MPAARTPVAGESMILVTVGVAVSICGPVWVRPVSDRLAALPAPSAIVTPVGRLTAVAASEAVFWPAATV